MHGIYNRRKFIKASGSILSMAALGTMTAGCSKKEKTEKTWPGFKYAMCNESMKDLTWAEQCKIVSDAGFKGIEIAAFTLVTESINDLDQAQRSQMVQVMKDHGLGMCWSALVVGAAAKRITLYGA